MRSQTLIVAVLSLATGCATPHIPHELRDSERLSVHKMTCSHPYLLSVGCKMSMIGTIPVELDGATFWVAGSADGRIVAVSDSLGHAAGSSYIGIVTLGTVDVQAARLAKAVQVVLARLKSAGLQVTETVVVTNWGEVQAYLVFTDGDAMKVLGVSTGDT